MRFGKDSLCYLLSCILSTVCLAACSNSLVQRNHAVGEQSRAAAATGIYLVLRTMDLSAAGYALSVGSGGVAVGTLILFLHSLHLQPVPNFTRKIFFLSPLMLAINNLLILAAGIAVNVIARTGVTEAHAYVGGRMIPDELTIAQAKASGLPLDYWSNDYVKFMAASVWPQIIPNFLSMFLAYRAWQYEKPSAFRQREAMHEHHHDQNLAPQMSNVNEKADSQHLA